MVEIPFEYATTNKVRREVFSFFLCYLDTVVQKSASQNLVTKWINKAHFARDLSNLKHTASMFYFGEKLILSVVRLH